MNINMSRTSESSRITSKGWTVSKKTSNKYNIKFPYHAQAYKQENKRYNVGYFASREEAARAAVAAAHRHGTLDWNKTMRWFRLEGFEISFDDVFGIKKYNQRKGWYVAKNRTSAGTIYYQITIGPSYDEAKYTLSASTRAEAIRLGLPLAMKKPYYDEYSTIVWLKRNNLASLTRFAAAS